MYIPLIRMIWGDDTGLHSLVSRVREKPSVLGVMCTKLGFRSLSPLHEEGKKKRNRYRYTYIEY